MAPTAEFAVLQRLGKEIPEEEPTVPRVQILTMHGAKGLSAQVVFIPGLEEELFPGGWRRPYPGLILEAARLLYVSITRARAACIISFARRRTVYGKSTRHVPSRFNTQLNGMFLRRTAGLNAAETTAITDTIRDL